MPVFSCGSSLYIDWRMVMVVGGMSYIVEKRRRNCPGEGMSGNINVKIIVTLSQKKMLQGHCTKRCQNLQLTLCNK